MDKYIKEDKSEFQKWDSGCWIRYILFEQALDEMPSADVRENIHGEWIVKKTERRKVFYCTKKIAHCPYCGHMEDRNIPNFCSNCGADLRGETE